ncbi:F-box protein At1g52495-like [Triticum urartu]|uniref:F-box protein At1g52495-like n=1 Tax=Triticum urartu TaxID=4572 RepID=UPI002042CBB2|nr:F-box protein At1g52495-like [Triticum urartu]
MACLPNELIVWEILVRLPIKSLWRIRCVCKDWRDTISGDPSFAQSHLHRLRKQNGKYHSLLIAPRVYHKVVESKIDRYEVTNPGLYLWEESRQHDATLLHDTSSFPVEETRIRHGFAHCDGLVLLPTEDIVRVLNPTTHQVLELPWSPNSIGPRRCSYGCIHKGHQAFGFGRSHRSNAYKAARFFYREKHAMGGIVMEVFTIGQDHYWHETAAQPPYPFLVGRIATFFKGSLIWIVDQHSLMYEYDHLVLHDRARMSCFVCFSLEDESFNIMTGPPRLEGPDYLEYSVAELNGELAVLRLAPTYESVEIWMCADAEGNKPQRWEQHYAFGFSSSVRLLATFDDDIVYQGGLSDLRHQTSQGDNIMVDMNNLAYYNPDMGTLVEYPWWDTEDFDVIFFIPSLVQI